MRTPAVGGSMRGFVAVAAVAVVLAGCGGVNAYDGTEIEMTLADVTDAEWDGLANRRFFFGHQSVGRNILAGVRTLAAEDPRIQVNVVTDTDPASVAGPGLIEANIGRNGAPETKADAFGAALAGGFGDETGAVAMYKYCYVDVVPTTDPDALFEDYVRRTEALGERYPGLTLVHITLPLRVAETGPKEWLKTVLGRETEAALNYKRARFNDRLREHFSGDPIFDLARLQSIRADGTVATSTYRGSRVPMLASEWSSDGGHLNDDGQRRLAGQFLTFLAKLPGAEGATTIADVEGPAGG
jgi:hypothetical protein